MPREGYRIETYRDPKAGLTIPVLAAAVSRERLFDCFLALLDPLGAVVDVVLETSHDTDGSSHDDLFREHIDLPVLEEPPVRLRGPAAQRRLHRRRGHLEGEAMEVQFDEHKLLVVYARDLEPFERVLRQAGLDRDDRLKLITEGEHLHSTDPRHVSAFEQLCYRLGVGAATERVRLVG